MDGYDDATGLESQANLYDWMLNDTAGFFAYLSELADVDPYMMTKIALARFVTLAVDKDAIHDNDYAVALDAIHHRLELLRNERNMLKVVVFHLTACAKDKDKDKNGGE